MKNELKQRSKKRIQAIGDWAVAAGKLMLEAGSVSRLFLVCPPWAVRIAHLFFKR